MRLLKSDNNGGFSLTADLIDDVPPYAILSHTWGLDTEEVNFKDMEENTGREKPGFRKISFCGAQARRDGLEYFWVDTCCIDKSNNTELSEAINSMFRWYHNSTKCYVYLSDVANNGHGQVHLSLHSWESAFRKSRWFTRGWTLQELIAPSSVDFFCSNGTWLGNKGSLEQQLHEITRIAIAALQGTSLSTFSIGDRMSWAKNRTTKRKEDTAYCLLGIFDIQMSLIYGEGQEQALERLQKELLTRSKKHAREEVLAVSHNSFQSNKRLKTSDHKTDNSAHLSSSDVPNNSSDAEVKKSLIDELYFRKIDERLTSLEAAQGTTCRWFLTKSEYTSWNDVNQQSDHGGFLWIKGHPGTGKSTLMKFLFEEAKLEAKGNPSQITLSFFFLARGTAEEKSTTGLYQSLLHQLFEKASDTKDSLDWMTADGARGIQRNGWHEKALKQTFKHAIQKLGSQSLKIFVDALDECEKTQATGMVCFFEELCDLAREAKVRLQICFSSRHYPTVVIQRGIELILEDEIGHTEDIKQYIKSKLRLGKSKPAEVLRSDILEKSAGIFLWVVLVLEIFNSEYPQKSISIKKIRERLKEIPPKLTDLFEMIIARDQDNLELLQISLQWILFAARPLEPQELYFAIQLGRNHEHSSYWDQEDVDLDEIKRFLRSSTKGLAEITRNKSSEVQFIHESVRDFLLGKYESQWSGVSGNFAGVSHEVLKKCCLAQLNSPISQDVIVPDPLPRAKDAAELRAEVTLKFPFLEYSVYNVFHHANYAQHNMIDQKDFLVDFSLPRWIFINNLLEKHDIRRYSKSASSLYIFAERNLTELIQIHPQKESCFNVEKERYGLPFFAAVATNSEESINTLLKIKTESQPETSPLHSLYHSYCQNKAGRLKLGRDFISPQRGDVISYVAEHGDNILLNFILESEPDQHLLDSKDRKGMTPLSRAAYKGHESVVKLLIEKGANIDLKDIYSRTPLLLAAIKGFESVVRLLIEKSAEVDSKDNNDRTILSWAANEGHESVVKLLIEKGAKIDFKDKNGRTPLIWAVTRGHESVVKLLIEKGANIDFKDKNGRTLLTWALD